MNAAEELRAAAVRLRCDHRHPVQPPHGSMAFPGDCSKCGAPWRSIPVSDEFREPLAALLDYAARNRDASVKGAASVSDESHTLDPDVIDQLTPFALPVARLVLGDAS